MLESRSRSQKMWILA